jgi:hypothetical protein
MEQKNVLTFADFTGNKEADIEGMFDIEFYLKLVNAEYKAGLQKPLTRIRSSQKSKSSFFD